MDSASVGNSSVSCKKNTAKSSLDTHYQTESSSTFKFNYNRQVDNEYFGISDFIPANGLNDAKCAIGPAFMKEGGPVF